MSQLSLLPSADIAAAVLSTTGRFTGMSIANRVNKKVHAVNDVILDMYDDGLLIEHRHYGCPNAKKYQGYHAEWECKKQPK